MANTSWHCHYACPCSDVTSPPDTTASRRTSIRPTHVTVDQDQAFNPNDPRANCAVYPLEDLLYCDECDAIRCPRCWTEEVLYWYCPSCLFEVPSSAVRSDGNRCSRSCYDCPSCFAPLAVVQSNTRNEELLKPSDAAANNENHALQCQYCNWNSLSIGVQLNRPSKITEQLAKIRKTGSLSIRKDEESSLDGTHSLELDGAFSALTTFYKDQFNDSGESQSTYSNSPYSSPANLARIMSLYGGLSYNALKKSREKPQPMREAMERQEGFAAFASDVNPEYDIIQQMQAFGWDGTPSTSQRQTSPVNHEARFASQLWPSATPLRTRRGKRCKACRQFLARPEPKVGVWRYRIRLLAMNHVPRLSIRPLYMPIPQANPAFALRSGDLAMEKLQPHQMKQYILTVRNPLFEEVRISLATTATTPGKVSSRVTILCPAFTVGPAGDLWDDALAGSGQSASEGERRAATSSLTSGAETSERQPEAGKIWDRTRNSTSVVVEVIPGSLIASPQTALATPIENDHTQIDREDNDLLEIPIYVRAVWEAEVKPGEHVQSRKDTSKLPGEKVQKELGYWALLAVGRIADV